MWPLLKHSVASEIWWNTRSRQGFKKEASSRTKVVVPGVKPQPPNDGPAISHVIDIFSIAYQLGEHCFGHSTAILFSWSNIGVWERADFLRSTG